MLFQNKKLNRLLLGAIVVALAVPLINVFIIYPHFDKHLISEIEDSAVRLAQHMENELAKNGEWHSLLKKEKLSTANAGLLNRYLIDFNLRKMKIFSSQGVAIYSTDREDVGKVNKNSYFTDEVGKGRIFSKVVKKSTDSLEGQVYEDDVVEVYVPILRKNNFEGAFELYYTITGQIASLDRLTLYASILPFAVSIFLLFALYWGFKNLDMSLIEQRKAQEEIRALQGIIPICSYCKGIRDDKGYWNQLEAYIESRSEAQFSHGVCDSCLEKHYGKEFSEEIKNSMKS